LKGDLIVSELERNYAYFYRKVNDIRDHILISKCFGRLPYKIEKIIELSAEEYLKFTEDFLEYYSFITENKELMYEKDGILHCILVKDKNSDEGVLIESEGYDYPRYTARIKYEG
jgi:hypothetical protein